MTRKACCVVVLVALVAAAPGRGASPPMMAAGRVALPGDFFINEFRGAEASFDLTQRSERLFVMRHHLGGHTIPQDAGLIFGLISVCVAAGLSSSRGFSGWAMTTNPVPPDRAVKEIYVTIVLLNHGQELTGMPSPRGGRRTLRTARPATARASR